MIKQEQIAAYREMAKNVSDNSMEAQIRANLESTCDKFAGKSVATAEIAPNGNVVQFYADEDREKTEDMKPTAEAQTVLEKWIKDFGKDAVKAMKKVA